MQFPAPNPPQILARNRGSSQTPGLVAMHGTVSHDDPGTARQIALRWHRADSPVTSCHYVVDPAEVIQCVLDHTVAYHCGYNQDSIGIELCDEETGPASRWADANSQAILAKAEDLVAQLCLAYGIPARFLSDAQLKLWDARGRHAHDGGIVTHAQMSRVFKKSTHVDPLDWPASAFLIGVKAAIVRRSAPPSTVVVGLHQPKPAPRRWSSFFHLPGSRVYEEDSLRGIDKAAARPDKAIDLNTCGRTKDGVIVGLHWPQPLLHGFKWDKKTPARLRQLPKTVTIHELTWADSRHLVAGDGYKIQRLDTLLTKCARLGVRAEVEAKGGRDTATSAFWIEVMGWGSSKSLNRRGLLQGKTLVLIQGAPRRVAAMKTADMVVIVSTTGAANTHLRLADYSEADYVRGPVTWVV